MKTTGAYLLSFYLLLIGMGINAQNAPISTIGSYSGNETNISIPITVTDFNNIGSCNLKLTYNPSIALATEVTSGELLVGQLAANLSEPGVISIGWYTVPGLTLPDNSVIFNIKFQEVSSGSTELLWDDDGYSCSWSDEGFNYLNDEPTSSYYIDGSLEFQLDVAPHTIAPTITTCGDSLIEIPIRVTGFNNIGAVSLTLQFNPVSLLYQDYSNDSGFPGLILNESNPGEITAAAFTTIPDGFSLADSAVLFTLYCINLGNSTELNWYDDGESCEYAGSAPFYDVLEDTPQESFYFDGSFTHQQIPGPAGTITGPTGGQVCQGQTDVVFNVDPINSAENYEWTLPEGTTITAGANTNSITVTFNQNASNGNVSVFGTNACGNGVTSPNYFLTINEAPSISQQPVSSDTILAGEGIANFTVIANGANLEYQWQEYVEDWLDIDNGGVYGGVYSASLTITNPPVTMNGYQYRCIVSGACEPQVLTDGLAKLNIVTFTGLKPGNPKIGSSQSLLNFKVYPNPFRDNISISFDTPGAGNMKIEIRNMLGDLIEIFTVFIISAGSQLQTFELENYPAGLYSAQLTFSTNNRLITATTKIICN